MKKIEKLPTYMNSNIVSNWFSSGGSKDLVQGVLKAGADLREHIWSTRSITMVLIERKPSLAQEVEDLIKKENATCKKTRILLDAAVKELGMEDPTLLALAASLNSK
jgi:hypothetical protein